MNILSLNTKVKPCKTWRKTPESKISPKALKVSIPAPWGLDTWSAEGLSPYFDTVLEAFTPKRLMFGSDWPVVTLASSYRQWIGKVRDAIAQLSADERDWILAKTAIEAYRLTTA